jgi:curved DNA-binding protein CbpA
LEDYYTLLGVPRDATEDQIIAAFRAEAKVWHPDHRPDDERASTRFQKLVEAKEVLLDPLQRQAYDARCLEKALGGRAPLLPGPAAATQETRRPRAGAGVGELALVGTLLGVGWLLVTAPSWDGSVGRYRGGNGRFRKGW